VSSNPSILTILQDWSITPSVVVGTALAAVIYVRGLSTLRRRGRLRRTVSVWHEVSFALGLLAVVVALLSPVDSLSGELLSVHMVQHFLLLMVAPPLLLMGKPIPVLVVGAPRGLVQWIAVRHARVGWFRRLTRVLTSPFFAWPLFSGTMLAWHIPSLFDAALQDQNIHVLEHFCFFVTALPFWWVILQPYPGRPHLSHAWRFLYVLLAMIPDSALGLAIILSGTPVYAFYTHVPRLWGISVLDDQLLAGNIMMDGGDAVLGIALLWLFVHMMARLEQIELARFARPDLS
jgi:cytochrome c oxidase assembly factor CtaG